MDNYLYDVQELPLHEILVKHSMRPLFCLVIRGHPSRTSGLPGGGGVGKPDIYCYYQGNSIDKPREEGERGSKILILAERP